MTSRRQMATLRQVVEQRPWMTERFLRRLVAERRVPYHKFGGKLLFDIVEIDALVEEGRVEASRPVQLLHPRRRSA